MDIADLVAHLSVEDQMSAEVQAAMRRVEAAVTNASDVTERSMTSMQESMGRTVLAGTFLGNMLANVALKALAWGKDLVTGSLMAGARLEQLSVASVFLGEKSGYTATQINDLSAQIQKSGIDGINARDAIVQLLGANIDLAQATKLSAIAQNQASISGESSSETFKKIVRGIATLQPELLRTAGLTVSLEQVMRKASATTGQTAQAMSGAQKQQLLLNEVLKQGEASAGLYGRAMDTAGKQASSAERVWTEVSISIGTALLPVTNTAIKAWYAFGTTIRNMTDGAQSDVKGFVQAAADALQIVIDKAGEMAKALIDVGKTIFAAWQALPDHFKRMAIEVGLLTLAFVALTRTLNFLGGLSIVNWVVQATAAFRVLYATIAAGNVIAGSSAGGWAVFRATMLQTVGTGNLIQALLVALGFALYEVGVAVTDLYAAWSSGKSMWDFFTAKDDQTFLRRWFGLSEAVGKVEDRLDTMGNKANEMAGFVEGAGFTVDTATTSVNGLTTAVQNFNDHPMLLPGETDLGQTRGFFAQIQVFADDLEEVVTGRIRDTFTGFVSFMSQMWRDVTSTATFALEYLVKAFEITVAALSEMIAQWFGSWGQAMAALPPAMRMGIEALMSMVPKTNETTASFKHLREELHLLAEGYRALNAVPSSPGLPSDVFVGPKQEGAAGPTGLKPREQAAEAEALSRAQQAALKKYQDALGRYTAYEGKDYLAVVNAIGNATYEGIAADLKRGQTAADLAQVYKMSEKDISRVKAAEEAWNKETNAFNDSMRGMQEAFRGVPWDGTIEGAIRLGASTKDIAGYFFGMGDAGQDAVRRVEAEMKTAVQILGIEGPKAAGAFEASLRDIGTVVGEVDFKRLASGANAILDARKDTAGQIAKLSLTSRDLQIQHIWDVAAEAEKAYKGLPEDYAEFAAEVERLAGLQVEATRMNYDAITNDSRRALQQTADYTVATYQYMLAHIDEFSVEVIATWREMAQQATLATQGLGAHLVSGLQDVLKTIPSILQRAFEGGGSAVGAAKSLGIALANAVAAPLQARMLAIEAQTRAPGGPNQQGARYASGATGVGTGVASGVGGMIAGSAGSILGGIAGGIGGAAVAGMASVQAMGAVSGAIAIGAATAGIGLAAVGAYYGLKKLFSLSAEYKATREAQQTLVEQLRSVATEAQVAGGALTDTYHTLAIVGRDAFLAVGDSAAETDRQITALLDIKHPQAYAAAVADLGRALQITEAHIPETLEAIGFSADDAKEKLQALMHMSPVAFQAALDKIKRTMQEVEDGVGDVRSAWSNAGRVIPTAMIQSIEKLLQMRGLTLDQREALRGLVDDAVPNYKELTATAAEYGITLAGLGPKFQQMATEDAAKKLTDDFLALTQAGADVGGVLLGMSGAADVAAMKAAKAVGDTAAYDEAMAHFGTTISGVVDQALTFGTAIPENMKPLIENLIKAGKLTDENGDAIKDISKLTFEQTPLDKGLDKLNKAIDHLAEVLSRIPGLATDAGNALAGMPAPNAASAGSTPSSGQEENRGAGPPVFPEAEGGAGHITGPTLFYSKGNEDFWFSGENKASGSSPTSSGGGTTHVVIEVDRRTLAEFVVPELPGVIQRLGLGR